MSLISMWFVFFLPIVTGVNFILPKRYRYIWLFAASVFFYLANDVRFATGMAICVVTTYVTGLFLGKAKPCMRKALLTFCILANILMLFLFRYSSLHSVWVPIGISFYTLQAISYVIDVYRNQIEPECNPVKYGLYVSFFPTVISGPIQRGTGLLQQIKEGRDFSYDRAHAGLYDLLKGYLLKLVLANQLGGMVDYAYANYDNMPGATLLWATVLYAVQLYFDFAGYSALAIGTAKILGFELEENFQQPYFACSVKDFWRRWHISLSSWLKDYVYIPLGGNRKGRCRKCCNLLITFLISGLWHGTGIQFLIWGALHGIYQIAGNLVPGKKEAERKGIRRVFSVALTFLLVDFAWLFFRAESPMQAVTILHRICCEFHIKEMTFYGSYLLGGTKLQLLFTLIGILFVFLVDVLHERKIFIEDIAKRKIPTVVRWGVYLILTFLILFAAVHDYGQVASTFIYERF